MSRVGKIQASSSGEEISESTALPEYLSLSTKVPQQCQRCPGVMEETEAEAAIQTWQH